MLQCLAVLSVELPLLTLTKLLVPWRRPLPQSAEAPVPLPSQAGRGCATKPAAGLAHFIARLPAAPSLLET